MDLATVGGLVIGLVGLIAGFLLEGGGIGSLLSHTAFLIVFGGTVGATVISFSLEDLKKIPVYIKEAFSQLEYDFQALIIQMVELANKARREGLLSLEPTLKDIEDPFLRKGLSMVVDGTEGSRLREMMETEIYCSKQRAKTGIEIFQTAGGYAPTMGIIGTVMGLVNVLSHLSNPEELGHSIAVAFIATLYGVASANILWLPIASKLKARLNIQTLYKELTLEGIMSLHSGEASSLMKEKLLAFLDEKERDIFQTEG